MPRPTQESFDSRKSINAGYLKKNRPPNAGVGRKRGQRNVVTQSTREIVHDFVLKNISSAQDLYDRVAKKEPAKALQILTNLCDFVLPRLARTDMNVTGDPLVSPTAITDAAEAAATYQSLMGNTKFDLTVITFAPPAQAPIPESSVVVIQPAPQDNVLEFGK